MKRSASKVSTEKHQTHFVFTEAIVVIGTVLSKILSFTIYRDFFSFDNLGISVSIAVQVESTLHVVNESHVCHSQVLGNVLCSHTLLLILVGREVTTFIALTVLCDCWIRVDVGTSSID